MIHVPDASIIIPYYNNSDTINRAVQSVLAQTFTDFEIVVVDDGSEVKLTDNISASARNRISVLRHESNRGPAAARNSGIKQSKGRYVAFLDADDSWRPDKLERQLEALHGAPSEVRACFTGFALHREASGKVENFVSAPKHPFVEELVWGCRVSPGSTLLCLRDCFDTVGLFDENLRRLEDWDWLLRFAEQYEPAYIPIVLTDVFLSTGGDGANPDIILHATQTARDKHQEAISRLGLKKLQQFLSTLALENAAARYRSGDKLGAVFLVGRSFLIWPFRNPRFFRRLLECVFK